MCQSGYAVELKEHCAGVLGFAVVSRFYVGLSMHLGARGDVLPVGRAGLHCGWVHDSEWFATSHAPCLLLRNVESFA